MEKNAPRKLAERAPTPVKEHSHDSKGNDTNLLKSFWKKLGKVGESLKQFARRCRLEGLGEATRSAGDWFHNKGANTSKPQRAIGRTRKKRGTNQGGKPSGK